MVVLYDAWQRSKALGQVILPVTHWHQTLPILPANKLSCINTCTVIYCSLQHCEGWHSTAFECLLDEPKTTVGANFVCPAIRKLRVMDLWRPMATLHVRYHKTKQFLFCPTLLSQWGLASVSLPKSIILKEIVQVEHNCIWPLADEVGFIDKRLI